MLVIPLLLHDRGSNAAFRFSKNLPPSLFSFFESVLNAVGYANTAESLAHNVCGWSCKTLFGNDEMAEGTIKRVTDKGFGFIDTGSEKDLFFHSSNLEGVQFDDLREGQRVTYSEGRGPKGPCAENVQLAE
jgi:CspA family cold shock protein